MKKCNIYYILKQKYLIHEFKFQNRCKILHDGVKCLSYPFFRCLIIIGDNSNQLFNRIFVNTLFIVSCFINCEQMNFLVDFSCFSNF